MNISTKFIIILFILMTSVANAGLINKLDGIWEGMGNQTSGQQWSIKFTSEKGIFEIEYPSLTCSGTWSFISETSGSVTFRQNIQIGRSRCINTGIVEVLWIEKNKLRYTWYYSNGKIGAYGELTCSTCNVNIIDNNNNKNTGTVFSNLDIHVPSLNYQTLLGTQNIWTDFKYTGLNTEGKHSWELNKFGENQ